MKKSIVKIKNEKRKFIDVSIKFSNDEIAVGKLILDNRLVHFKYNDEFLALGLNLSPIKLQFDNSIQIANPERNAPKIKMDALLNGTFIKTT